MIRAALRARDYVVNFEIAKLIEGRTTCIVACLLTVQIAFSLSVTVGDHFAQVGTHRNVSAVFSPVEQINFAAQAFSN